MLRFFPAEAQQRRFIETSAGYNVPFLEKMTDHPIWSSNPKYAFVKDIMKYTHPPGYPGPQTAASQVVMALHTIPEMFARAATEKMTVKEAIAWAERCGGEGNTPGGRGPQHRDERPDKQHPHLGGNQVAVRSPPGEREWKSRGQGHNRRDE